MDKSVAVKKLHKILGKGFCYRVSDKALDKDGREAARAELRATIEERNKLREIAAARRNEILFGDQDYQAKLAAYKAARDKADRLQSCTHSYRITVGNTTRAGGFGFFHVKAQGDNWEEVIEKVAQNG